MTRPRGEKPVFSFVSGRGHGPGCWEMVRESLSKNGYTSIAPELPIEDRDVSLDDHAKILSEAEESFGRDEVIRIGWSWGANVVSRAVDDSVKKIIYLAPGFHSSTIQNHPNASRITLEHGLMYEILQGLQGAKRLKFAEQVYYHDVSDPTIVRGAVDALRDHPYREDEPVLETFPAVPLGYIALLRDTVITLKSQRTTARALEVKMLGFHSGHAPMYSRPEYLATRLIELSRKDNRLIDLPVEEA